MMLSLLLALAAPAVPDDLAASIAAYDQAQVKGDRAALERLLADDYLLVNSHGQLETKAELIADYAAPGFSVDPFKVQEPVTRVWETGAVAGGIVVLTGTDRGMRYLAKLRFTDVWAKRGGRWQVVYTQAANLPEERR